MSLKVGSLFTGYGGLDIAVGGDLAWYAEIEPAACQVLAHHYPNVPNLGDITKIDWSQVEPVDVITGGYPCQPFSHAGLRKGKNDERHLWPYVRDAIDALRPQYAILENVSGHLTLGFGDVLADLATIGFNVEWGTFRASDVGAPHGRKRLFIIAYPDSQGLQGSPSGSGETQTKRHGHFEQGAGSPTNSDSTGSEASDDGRPRDGFQGRPQPMECGGSITAHTQHDGSLASEGRRSLRADAVQGWQQQQEGSQRQSQGSGDSQSAADTTCKQCRKPIVKYLSPFLQGQLDHLQYRECDCVSSRPGQDAFAGQWGNYAPAIERWEHVLGRPAPAPTIQRNDRQRLNPVFVEWMMGLDEGHVTGHGLSAAKELKMLGNGVVPQQAHAAITQLLERITP